MRHGSRGAFPLCSGLRRPLHLVDAVFDAIASPHDGSAEISFAACHALIAGTLRGDRPRYPADAPPELASELLQLARLHGAEALLSDALSRHPPSAGWPDEVTARLKSVARAQALWDLAVELELEALLPVLARRGIDVLLFKGAPLAYSLYPQPHLRTRCDTDILVPFAQRRSAHEVLLKAGYEARNLSPGGFFASSTQGYGKRLRMGAQHEIDLHWRLSNSPMYAETFSFAELARSAVAVPVLGDAARMPSLVHAMLIACMHRTSHLRASVEIGGVAYTEANRLVWLYDIHLLAGAFTPEDWTRLADLADAKRLRAIVRDGLAVCRRTFDTAVPEQTLLRLDAPGPRELSARYLNAGAVARAGAEIRALHGWRARSQFISERLFPPADYMLRAYGRQSRAVLPWLYLRRILEHLSPRRP